MVTGLGHNVYEHKDEFTAYFALKNDKNETKRSREQIHIITYKWWLIYSVVQLPSGTSLTLCPLLLKCLTTENKKSFILMAKIKISLLSLLVALNKKYNFCSELD